MCPPQPARDDEGGVDSGRLEAQLDFVLEADRLKGVHRRTTLMDGSRRENSAEHSWYLALAARVLAEYAPPGTDIERVVDMLVVHDLVEIDAGDTFIYSAEATRAQPERESRAADRLFALLPEEQARRFRALWEEFEGRQSPEARFAKAIDRLAPMLANWQTRGGTWLQYGITKEQALGNVGIIAEGSEVLGRYARGLIDDAARRGYFASSPPEQAAGA
jgi:putative hydrolases of HD superfamily